MTWHPEGDVIESDCQSARKRGKGWLMMNDDKKKTKKKHNILNKQMLQEVKGAQRVSCHIGQTKLSIKVDALRLKINITLRFYCNATFRKYLNKSYIVENTLLLKKFIKYICCRSKCLAGHFSIWSWMDQQLSEVIRRMIGAQQANCHNFHNCSRLKKIHLTYDW